MASDPHPRRARPPGMTTAQTAARLEVGRVRLAWWRVGGRGPAYIRSRRTGPRWWPPGGRVYYLREAVDRWKDQHHRRLR